MKCLVTGGAGFIGSHLVDRLVKDGHEVVIIDDLSTGNKENLNSNAVWNNMDIGLSTTPPYLEKIMNGVDVVFHLAAKARVQPSIEDPISFNRANVDGTLHLLHACKVAGVKRFVFSSSSSVYGNAKQLPTTEECELNPISPYALQKAIGEQYCKLFSEVYNLSTVCLRYFNVYGDRMSLDGAYRLVIPIFAQQKLDGESLTINGDGKQRRDFTHVDDVIEANIKTGFSKMDFNGDAFNIGNGDNRSVNQIAEMIGGDVVNLESVIEPKETLAGIGKANFVLNWKPNNKIEDWIKTYKKGLGI
jgi:UDP-glucose 4-epimerase